MSELLIKNKSTGEWQTIPYIVGPQGPQGIKGEKGDTGAQGEQGIQGIQGIQGLAGKDGVNGTDGITPHIGDNGNWFIGETDTGMPSRGEAGKDGEPGKDGADGQPGADGSPGVDGKDGSDGADGITPHIGDNGNWFIGNTDTGKPSRGADGHDGQDGEPGKDGNDGKDGSPGKDGEDGQPGKDGHTPVKGVDYWTEADKTEMVQQVIAAIGTPVIGKVDESNQILIAGILDNGTYTVKYENEDGTTTTIGEFTVTDSESGGGDDGGDVVTITNQLPISTDYDGTVFNGTGYQVGKRINSGGTGLSDVSNASGASNPVFVTGFIPCGAGSVVRFKNCYMATTRKDSDAATYGQTIDNFRLMLANESKVMNQLITWEQLTTSDQITVEQDENGNVVGFTPKNHGVYVRMVLAGDPETAIITVNEEIPA